MLYLWLSIVREDIFKILAISLVVLSCLIRFAILISVGVRFKYPEDRVCTNGVIMSFRLYSIISIYAFCISLGLLSFNFSKKVKTNSFMFVSILFSSSVLSCSLLFNRTFKAAFVSSSSIVRSFTRSSRWPWYCCSFSSACLRSVKSLMIVRIPFIFPSSFINFEFISTKTGFLSTVKAFIPIFEGDFSVRYLFISPGSINPISEKCFPMQSTRLNP